MIITDLHIDRFGGWRDFDLTGLDDGLTVFYGPNEAGKTTLLQFIRAILYGFTPERCRQYLELPKNYRLADRQNDDSRCGGYLKVQSTAGSFQICRHAADQKREEPWGDVRLWTHDGERVGASRLDTLLTDIDETVYTNIFAVGLTELQQLATLNNHAAASHLYNLSTRVDRVALGDVIRALETSNAAFDGPAGISEIGQTLENRRDRQQKLQLLTSKPEVWNRLRATGDDLAQEIRNLGRLRSDLEGRCRTLELAISVRPAWSKSRKLQQEIDARTQPHGASEEIVTKVRHIRDELGRQRGQQDKLKQQRDRLREKIAKLPWNEELARRSDRFDALVGQVGEVQALEDRAHRLQLQAEELDFELQAEREKLGFSTDQSFDQLSSASVSLEALRGPAREWKRCLEQLEQAKRHSAEIKSQIQRFEQTLNAQITPSTDVASQIDSEGIVSALEQTGTLAEALRRRVGLDVTISRCQEKLQTVARKRLEMLQTQLLPWHVLLGLGFVFVLGFVLLSTGVFSDAFGISETNRSPLILLGGAAAGLALLMYKVLDNGLESQLDSAEEQYDALRTQLTSARRECARLEKKLPSGETDYVSLLQATERELTRLERLLPLDANRQDAQERWAKAEQAETAAAEAEQVARDQWLMALGAAGLPERLTPDSLERFVGRSGNWHQLHERLQKVRAEIDATQREQDAFQTRMKDLLVEIGLIPKSSLSEQLEQLVEAKKSQQENGVKRVEFQKQMRQLKRAFEKSTDQVKQLKDSLRAVLADAGVNDSDTRLDELESDLNRLKELRKEKAAVDREIKLAVESHADAAQVRKQLEEMQEPSQLQTSLQSLRGQLRETDEKIKTLHEESGRLAEQLQHIRGNRVVAEKQFDLGMIDHQLQRQVKTARTKGVAVQMLKSVHRKHEKERQPETLKEASDLLRRLTSGRFVRVWTPVGKNVLRVDEQGGQTLPVELLSRGTREQVFLSLRLALVSAYARRGIKMPVVLDDILVNFDAERARCAAEVFLDFAGHGHQVFVFTCHEHIKLMFERLGLKVRDLPRPAGRLDTQPPLAVRNAAWKIKRLREYNAELDEELWAEPTYSADKSENDERLLKHPSPFAGRLAPPLTVMPLNLSAK